MVARTIPLAPFLEGRGKIIMVSGGHPQTPAKGRRPLDSRFQDRGSTKKGWGTPPDSCQRAAPSGLPLSGPRKYEEGLGNTPRHLPMGGALWTPALRTEEVRRRVGAHPQTPAKGRRPLDSRFEDRGRRRRVGAHPQTPANVAASLWTPAFRTAEVRSMGWGTTPRHLPMGGALWTPALRTEDVLRIPRKYEAGLGDTPRHLPMGGVPLDSGPFRYALGQRLTLSLELRHALDGAGFGHHAIDEREDEHER